MSDIPVVAGAKIYISDDPFALDNDDLVALDFAAVDFTNQIDGWLTMGEIGDTATEISTTLINRKRAIRQKGTYDGGVSEHTFVVVNGDAGQAHLRAAFEDTADYAFKIEYDDIPAGGTTPTIEYFVGKVMSYRVTGGDANTTRQIRVSVGINSNIVTVEAT